MKQLIESVQIAYAFITEAKQVESKFKVGDKVGVGVYSANNGLYVPHDTGSVSGVDKRGVHTITHDTWKEHDLGGNLKATESTFDPAGRGTHANRNIVSIEDHEANILTSKKSVDRANDMNIVLQHLIGARSENGNFAILDKGKVEHIKSLLDKHCA